MELEGARDHLRYERVRIEQALARLSVPGREELAGQDEMADAVSQLYEEEFDEGQADDLRAELAAGARRSATAVPPRPPREADETRLRAPAAEAEAQRERSERIRLRRHEQLQTRRQKLRALAELRAGGATQL